MCHLWCFTMYHFCARMIKDESGCYVIFSILWFEILPVHLHIALIDLTLTTVMHYSTEQSIRQSIYSSMYISIWKFHNSGINSMAMLKALHRLPVRSHMALKIITLCYKAYHLGMLNYLASSVQPYTLTQIWHSFNQDILTAPASRFKLAEI